VKVLAVAFLCSLVVVPFDAARGSSVTASDATAYTLPRSAFNITDHNLTFATNEVALEAPIVGSWEMSISDTLAGNATRPTAQVESEISFGPGPVPENGDETTITPIFIVQEAATGLLRIEYVPFPMNDTYGFIVYQGYPVAAGPGSFDGHTLSMTFDASALPIAPYPVSVPYGQANGNVSVALDGTTLVAKFPVDWSSFTAFYAYGLTTGGFVAGAMTAYLTPLPTSYSAPAVVNNGDIGSVPVWVVSAAIAAVVAGAAVAVVQRRGARGE